MKKIAITFCLGAICGVLFSGVLFAAYQFGQCFKSWGATSVYSDVQARKMIEESGVQLPPASWNLYYAASGFTDVSEWIAFTVPRDSLWAVVEQCTQRREVEFK